MESRIFHDGDPIYDTAIFGERNDTFIVHFSFGFDQLFLPSLGFLRGVCCWRVTIKLTDAEDTDETFSDYPPFSLEGLIDWLFERCHQRHMKAVSNRDEVKE